MNIVEKLNSIDQSKITNNGLIQNINTAIATIGDQHEDLTATELTAYQKLYDRATEHIKNNDQAELDRIAMEEKKKKRQEENEISEKKRAEQKKIEQEKAESERLENERIKNEKQELLNQQNEKQLKLKTMIENLTIPHLQYLQSKGVSMSSMPTEIKNKNIGFNLQYAKLKKDPSNEVQKQVVLDKSNDILAMIQQMEANKTKEEEILATQVKADEEAKKQNEESARLAAQEAQKKSDEDAATIVAQQKAEKDAKEAAELADKKRKGSFGNSFLKSIFGV